MQILHFTNSYWCHFCFFHVGTVQKMMQQLHKVLVFTERHNKLIWVGLGNLPVCPVKILSLFFCPIANFSVSL